MYSDKEILDLDDYIKYSYDCTFDTIEGTIQRVPFDISTIKVLDTSSFLDKETALELIDNLNKFTSLELMIINGINGSTYTLVKHILDNTEITVDARYGYKSIHRDYWIKKDKEKIKDLLCDRLLLHYCNNCVENLLCTEPNKCDNKNKWDGNKCGRIICTKCKCDCELTMQCCDVPHSQPTDDIVKFDLCYNQLEEYIRSNPDDSIGIKYYSQKLKTSAYSLIDNIPDEIVSMCYHVDPMYNYVYSEYKNISINDFKYKLISYLKDYKLDTDLSDYYCVVVDGPIFSLINENGNPSGWVRIVKDLKKFNCKNRIVKYNNNIQTIQPTKNSIEGLNLMVEKYQYHHCTCKEV